MICAGERIPLTEGAVPWHACRKHRRFRVRQCGRQERRLIRSSSEPKTGDGGVCTADRVRSGCYGLYNPFPGTRTRRRSIDAGIPRRQGSVFENEARRRHARYGLAADFMNRRTLLAGIRFCGIWRRVQSGGCGQPCAARSQRCADCEPAARMYSIG